jgi:hypothetical protein
MPNEVSHLCHTALQKVARPAGFEPATPGLEGQCSIQLSYGRVQQGELQLYYVAPREPSGAPAGTVRDTENWA